MFTYLTLNLIVLAIVCAALRITPHKLSRAWWYMLIGLILLTLVFDSIMIGLGFFSYNPDKILGIQLGNAPIEDFFYAILSAIMIPAIWYKLEKK